jgi:hypothetical protein
LSGRERVRRGPSDIQADVEVFVQKKRPRRFDAMRSLFMALSDSEAISSLARRNFLIGDEY